MASRRTLPRDEIRAMLAAQGFRPPEPWVEYARRHGFRRVPARRLRVCPDCGARPSTPLGQYVYFSHLAELRECRTCGLVYSDLRLADAVTNSHFEIAYKEDDYFLRQRARIFRQLARMIDGQAPAGASVLDVGAATGWLMAQVRSRRPDLSITLSDISSAACQEGERRGFRVRCSDLASLGRVGDRFDIVVMSDVIYFEPDVQKLWTALPRLVAPGGLLILRIPNKLAWIRLAQRSLHALAPRRAAVMDRIPFFNPEHPYIFSVRFLRARLSRIGFSDISIRPACILRPDGWRGLAAAAVDAGTRTAYRTIPRGPVLSLSIIMTARRSRVGAEWTGA